MNERARNVPASIHQRLLNIARDTDRPFNELLQYFAMERFLYRLSRSPHSESFILKGALLFRVWGIPDSRATRDIDFLAYMDNKPDNLARVVRETCGLECTEDGMVFDPGSVRAERIKEDADYEGVRVRFRGQLGPARIPMQVDVGFGDTVHPSPTQVDYPTVLDVSAPSLRIYPPEAVVAEKAQAMVYLGGLNSRMKDFYDIWRLSRQFDFDGASLSEALRSTFDNRGTAIVVFDELAHELSRNDEIEKLWHAFLTKSRIAGPGAFAEAVSVIGDFLAPVFLAVLKGESFERIWKAPGPWSGT